MIGPISTLIITAMVLLIIGRMITGTFSGRRAALQVKSLTGENLAVLLAVATIAEIMITVPDVPAFAGIPDNEVAGAIVAAALLAIAGLAVLPRITVAILSLAALVAFITDVYVSHGPDSAAMVIIGAVLMLTLLSIVRGCSPIS